MQLRRLLGLSAAISGHLRRGLSTSTSCPPWAMIYQTKLVDSPARRVSLELARPPCPSHLLCPAHLVDLDSPSLKDLRNGTVSRTVGRTVVSTSGDGLVIVQFTDLRDEPRMDPRHLSAPIREWGYISFDPDMVRFVCNPISGELFRLPDVDSEKKSVSFSKMGILTQSKLPHQPPSRYVVAVLTEDNDWGLQSFVMRRFRSETGDWDKPVGLPSPFPIARPFQCHDHEVLAFGGRLWWVDLGRGALSADPFSDQPDLEFVELPRDRVTLPVQGLRKLGRYRRMGVSEGRLRYVEVSQEEPFLLSSFVLDNDGSSWMLEHQMALSPLLVDIVHTWQDQKPRIGVVDPLNSSVIHLTFGTIVSLSVDMGKEKVLACSSLGEGDGRGRLCGFLKPCVLAPWLGSSQIPSAGTISSNKANFTSKTLSDTLVRVDRAKKNRC